MSARPAGEKCVELDVQAFLDREFMDVSSFMRSCNARHAEVMQQHAALVSDLSRHAKSLRKTIAQSQSEAVIAEESLEVHISQ